MWVREIINGIIQGGFTGNDSGNTQPLLMLGGFKFSLNTAVFQQMERSTSYRWPAQERLGMYDALQYTGPGEDRIILPGVVYPDFRGGAWQIESLRALASQGRPLHLIASTGHVLGLWVIENVSETQSYFKPDGTPRKQEFSVALRKHSDERVGMQHSAGIRAVN